MITIHCFSLRGCKTAKGQSLRFENFLNCGAPKMIESTDQAFESFIKGLIAVCLEKSIAALIKVLSLFLLKEIWL